MEYNAWDENTPKHEVNLVFTRMLEAPMDFSPGVSSLKGRDDRDILSTIAKQLALYVVLYSPAQRVADTPENYARYAKAFRFTRDVPVDRDDTRVLGGEIGDRVTIARQDRGSDDWFVGAVIDEQARTTPITLDFPRCRSYLRCDDLPRRRGCRLSHDRSPRDRDRDARGAQGRHPDDIHGTGRRLCRQHEGGHSRRRSPPVAREPS